MEFIDSKEVVHLINSYPAAVTKKLKQLRNLIINTAKDIDGVDKLVETTKWGEPSYLTKIGSTIRFDWKEKTPDKYFVYFICTTELVNTFRIMLGDEIQFEGTPPEGWLHNNACREWICKKSYLILNLTTN